MTITAMEREGLVTGEAVQLDLRPASFAVRIVSAVIDGALQLALLVGGVVAVAFLGARAGLDDGLVAAGVVASSVAAYIGYPVLCEALASGRSAGRAVMGTRVVRDDGGPAHVRQSLLRALMAMLELWGTGGSLALVCAVIDRRGRRVGDLLAGTLVIQERMRDAVADPLPLPEQLRPWAQQADVGRLPSALVQEIRSFLPRAESIHPDSRRAVVRDLVQRTLPHVAPAPPPGTDQEAFLTAVIAERSARDERRLRRDAARSEELVAEVRAVPFSH